MCDILARRVHGFRAMARIALVAALFALVFPAAARAASRAATTGATRTGPRSACAERGVSSAQNAVTFDALDTPPRLHALASTHTQGKTEISVG